MTELLNRERGFTLIEVIIAHLILVIVSMAIWGAFAAGSRFNADMACRQRPRPIFSIKLGSGPLPGQLCRMP